MRGEWNLFISPRSWKTPLLKIVTLCGRYGLSPTPSPLPFSLPRKIPHFVQAAMYVVKKTSVSVFFCVMELPRVLLLTIVIWLCDKMSQNHIHRHTKNESQVHGKKTGEILMGVIV